MESSAKYALVGLFVFVAAILFVIALFWLAEVGGSRNTTYYAVYFRNHSLDGLQVDSAVTMKGIKVGTVASYHISPQSVEEVKVTLRLENDIPVKQDTEAVLKRNLLTGLAFIDLVGSSDQSPLRTEVPAGESYPIIPEGSSQLEKIADSIPSVLTEVNGMVSRASAVFSEDNIASLQRSLQNIETVTSVFAERKGEIEAILVQLERTTADISAASKSLNSFAAESNKSLDRIGAEASSVLTSLDVAVKGIDSRTKEMSVAMRAIAQVLEQEISALSQNVNVAAESIARTAERFEDPRAILAGPSKAALGPGEKVTP